MALQLDRVPDINYEAHPAFSGFAAASDEVNMRADALIAEIDDAYEAALSVDNPQNAFDLTVRPSIASLIRLAKDQVLPPAFMPFLSHAMDLAQDTMRKNMTARAHTLSNSAPQDLPEARRNDLDAFHRDGFFRLATPDLAQQIWRSTWIERGILRIRAARKPRHHAVLALHPASPAVRAIQKAARDGGLEAIISTYVGKPVTLYYVSLDYAHSSQTWFKGCYAQEGLKDSKTVYMHFDADTDIIKALFYLRDVTEKDGPFRFVRGSHRWNRSPFQLAIRKGFDEASTTSFPMTPDRLDFLQGYYRPRFQTADYKAGMLALPRALRGSTHFGDDVLDGSDLSEALLRDEHTFVGPAGTMVVFDGSRGIHRGSLTQDGGERWALQIAFKVRDNVSPRAASLKTLVRAKLSYLKHAAVNFLRLVTGRV